MTALDRASQRSHPLPLARKHPNAPSGKTPTPPFPKQGAGGAASAGGTASPPVSKNVGGRCGRDSGAGQARPSAEGGRRPQQAHPSPIPATRRGGSLCPTPLAKYERVCYSAPMKWATGPLLFLGACRIHEHWGLTTENPPVAGALREQPKGQDRPRKAGTGANAVVRHRLLGACRIHIVLGANHRESPCGRSAEGTTQGARPPEEGWDRSQCRCTAQALWSHPAPRRIRDASATATRRLHDGSTTTGRRRRRKSRNTYNQRMRLRPGEPSHPYPHPRRNARRRLLLACA